MIAAGFRSLTWGRRLALITAAGAALRIVLGVRQGLGFDEDFTAVAVSHPIGETLRIVSRDSAPPLFYVLENVAAGFGATPWNLRLVPVAAGIALIPLLATLARRVAGDAAALWTAALVAVLPAALFTATNARMYGLAGTLVVAATLLLWRAVERPGPWRYAAFGAVCAAALWTDYFSAPALAGVVVAAVVLRPSRRVYATACLVLAAAAVSLVPWLVYAGAQLNHAGQGFWVAPLSPAGVAGTAGQLFAGPENRADPPLGSILLALQVVAAVAGALALAALAARRRQLAPEQRRAAGFALLSCGGIVALAAISVRVPLLEARYAGLMWLPLFALAGTGLTLLPRGSAAVLLAAMAVSGLALSSAVTHSGTTDLLPELEARVGAHDMVAADPDHYLLLLAESGPNVVARLHVLAAADPAWYFGTAAYSPDAVARAVPAEVPANRGLIFYVGDPGTDPAPLPPGYREQELRCLSHTCLAVYGPGG